MKQKRNYFNRYTASLLAVLIIATGAVLVVKHNTTDAVPASGDQSGKSEFSFAGATDWWQGATNETSMAVFHNTRDCFVSAEHKTGVVDVAAELQKSQDMLANDGYTVTPGSIQTLTIQTPAGPKQYELHQSAVTTPTGATVVEGGQEFAYLQLDDGYLKIMGYCDTPDELPATIPALQAYKFDTTKN